MENALNALRRELAGAAYKPLDEEQIQRQARSRYDAEYGQRELVARQAYEAGELALEREARSLDARYDRQAQNAEQAARRTASETDRHALSRGMQRSSYNGATLANVRLAGERTQRDIEQARAQTEEGIDRERTLAQRQLAQALAQAQTGYASDVAAYADTLRDREYERSVSASRYANELAMAMYEYAAEQEKQRQAQARWIAEFSQSVREYEDSRAGKSTGSTKSASKSSGLGRTVASGVGRVTGWMGTAGTKN